mmetsp:Transcript_13205/g.18288  ORF Transcript_13205/g.18288 Transcript_13205/m.18288 type:complete len:115 (+) Transcript_13205:1-345(+)
MEEIELAEALKSRDQSKAKEHKDSASLVGNAYSSIMQQAESEMSKSKKRRNRKKKQIQAQEKKTSAKTIQDLLAKASLGSKTVEKKRTQPPQNPRCFVCLKRHAFGQCGGMGRL